MTRSKWLLIPLLIPALGMTTAAQATLLVFADLAQWQYLSADRHAPGSSLPSLCFDCEDALAGNYGMAHEVGNYLQITPPADLSSLGSLPAATFFEHQHLLMETGGETELRKADDVAPLATIGTGLLVLGIFHARTREKGAD